MATDYIADLPPHCRALLDADIPRFSDAEMTRRREAMAALLEREGVDHLVFCGYTRAGSCVQWLTHWPATNEALAVFTPGTPDALFVQYVNHAVLARLYAKDCETVEWGGERGIVRVVETLKARGALTGRVGVIGPMPFAPYTALAQTFGPIRDLNRAYAKLRAVKSAEELDWLRIGAALSDAGMAALQGAIAPGVSERELSDAIERAYVAKGGGTGIHFIGTTPMHDPSVPAPKQYPSARRVAQGDIVFAEIAAHLADHSGQVLRSFAVGVEPPDLYRRLHEAAARALDAICGVLRAGATPAEVIEASGVIEDAGFTIIDDLVHGYGGGYLPPILGTKSRPAGPVPEEPFAAGQTLVVQPNVVTRDGKAGVQTGELLVVTETGVESLHRFPRGFLRASI